MATSQLTNKQVSEIRGKLKARKRADSMRVRAFKLRQKQARDIQIKLVRELMLHL